MLRNPSSVLKACAAFALLQVLWASLDTPNVSAYASFCMFFMNLSYLSCFQLLNKMLLNSFKLQFTIPGGRHAMHHASLMQNAGAARVLRAAAAAATAPLAAKIFARIVLRNLEHHNIEPSL